MLVSITRLRVRSIRYYAAFMLQAFRSGGQVSRAPGFLGGALLPDRNWAFWTMTGWDSLESMRAYMMTGAHKDAMPKLAHWCDEASVVHWEQATGDLPNWTEAEARMRREGRPSKVRHPGPHHQGLNFPSPRSGLATPIAPARRDIQ